MGLQPSRGGLVEIHDQKRAVVGSPREAPRTHSECGPVFRVDRILRCGGAAPRGGVAEEAGEVSCKTPASVAIVSKVVRVVRGNHRNLSRRFDSHTGVSRTAALNSVANLAGAAELERPGVLAQELRCGTI